ncbi:C-type lectin domain family 2 member D-like isoform X2 [Varanus komodoensis]|uniref:C-type lectin domain family 2 member D-like isoform X2 n=1 Tax=Varanus komodoensis TaxID=61221 RepID=UPI001CF77C42|nr:C-type lectin domain family 2 member D-like isoform X2 [Varanus komodoensis]
MSDLITVEERVSKESPDYCHKACETQSKTVLLSKGSEQPLSGPACPNKWIGYQGKCYYFSEEKRNWTSSQDFCLSHNASLMAVCASEEKDVVMRLKGKPPFWIGLQKDSGQHRKTTNGDNSTLQVISNGGDCTFLSSFHEGTAARCHTKLPWICSKLDAFMSSNAG